MSNKSFFSKIVSAGTQESSRRWITVVASMLFFFITLIMTGVFIVLFIESRTVRYVPLLSQKTIDNFFELYEKVLNLHATVILTGIGAIVLGNISGDILSKWIGRRPEVTPTPTPTTPAQPFTPAPPVGPVPPEAPQELLEENHKKST